MTVSYQWRNVTRAPPCGTSAFQALDTTVAAPSDVIECSATVTDAGGESSTGSGTVDTVNRAPVLGTVTISSTNITCLQVCLAAQVPDPDGETPSISHVWVNDGVTIGGSSITLNANIAQPGDIYSVWPQPWMHQVHQTQQCPCVDFNTGPVVDSVSITPDPAYNDNTLSCIVVASDADGQSLTTTYLWKISTLEPLWIGLQPHFELCLNLDQRHHSCIATVKTLLTPLTAIPLSAALAIDLPS